MKRKRFFKILGLLFLIAVIFLLSWIKSDAQDIETQELHPVKQESYTKDEIRILTDRYAEEYGIDKHMLETVVSHESQYIWNQEGDGGTSVGVAQIHLSDHPDITKDQALDPNFALDWMAKNIKNGQGSMWTGYRVCVLNEKVMYQGRQIRCQAKN